MQILAQNGHPQFCVKIHPIEKHNQAYQKQTRFGQRFFNYSLLDIEKCSKENENVLPKAQLHTLYPASLELRDHTHLFWRKC